MQVLEIIKLLVKLPLVVAAILVMALFELTLLLSCWVLAFFAPSAALKIVNVSYKLPDPRWYINMLKGTNGR